jgi:hypothetical protein
VVSYRKRGALARNLVELVGKASPGAFPAQSRQPVTQSARNRLGLGLSGQLGNRFRQPFRFCVPDVQGHR